MMKVDKIKERLSEEEYSDMIMEEIRFKCDIHYLFEDIKDVMYGKLSREEYSEICEKIDKIDRTL